MAEPKAKPTLQDYWKIPFRGFVPGGLSNSALPKITELDDAPVMEESEPESDVRLLVVKNDIRVYFHAFQIQVGDVETEQVLGNDICRRRALIRNVGPGTVFIGATESIGRTGYGLAQITTQAPLEVVTTEEMWALQETGQSGTAVLHILVEFDKRKDNNSK